MGIRIHGIVPDRKRADLVCLGELHLDSGPTLHRISVDEVTETQTQVCLSLDYPNGHDIDQIAHELVTLFVKHQMDFLKIDCRRVVLVESAVAMAIRDAAARVS